MSGFEVLSHLIRIAPRFAHMPFVFLTGLTDRDSKLRGWQLGVDDYVIKPFDFDVLGTIITARLAHVARTGVSTRELQLNNRAVETITRTNARLRSASFFWGQGAHRPMRQ
jgi:DNA-binding response OmpR family regulator